MAILKKHQACSLTYIHKSKTFLIWQQVYISHSYLSDKLYQFPSIPLFKGKESRLKARQTVTNRSQVWQTQQAVCPSTAVFLLLVSGAHFYSSKPLTFSLTAHHCRWECQLNSLSENLMLNIGQARLHVKVSCMKRYSNSHLNSDSPVPRVRLSEPFHTLKQTSSLWRPRSFTTEWCRWLIIPGRYTLLRDRKSALALRRAHCCALFRAVEAAAAQGLAVNVTFGSYGSGCGWLYCSGSLLSC